MRTTSRSQAYQASARATLLWAAAGVLLLQGSLRLAIDRLWPELRDPTFEVKLRRLNRARAEAGAPALTIVMTGSSVTMNGFKAKDLEEQLDAELGRDTVVFNLGTNGAGPVSQLVWTRRLLARGMRPDLLCVEVSPQTYSSTFASDVVRYPAHVLTREDFATLAPFVPTADLKREWRRYRWCPAHFHRLTLLCYTLEPLVPLQDRVPTWNNGVDERCWSEQRLPPTERHQANIRAIQGEYAPKLVHFVPDPTRVEALETLLATLRREGIATIVAAVPQSPAFRQLYGPGRREQFIAQVAERADRHQVGFVDASDWLGEEHFTDCLHPTTTGAELFSTRLKRALILPMLKKENRQIAGR